jgi:hypothetical protein
MSIVLGAASQRDPPSKPVAELKLKITPARAV